MNLINDIKPILYTLAAVIGVLTVGQVSIYKADCRKQEKMADAGFIQQPTIIGPMWIPRELYQDRVLTTD